MTKRNGNDGNAKVPKKRDHDIDTSDIPELNEEFFKNASFRMGSDVQIIEPEILAYFKMLGNDYKERINDLLRVHIDVMSRKGRLSRG